MNPKEILDNLDLKPDMIVADFGSGSGKFSIPLAKKLEDGLVYAIDVQKPLLNVLKSRCIYSKINNIDFVLKDLEKGTGMAGSFFDLVMAVDILLQIKNRNAIISEASRVLKNNGLFFASDRYAVSPAELIKSAKESGMKLKKTIDMGEQKYGLIFKKI